MSDEINTGGPAFPILKPSDPRFEYCDQGMTLRDWFAGQAIAALIRKAPFFDRDGEFGKPVDMLQFKADMSVSAYAYADAMLAARNAK